MVGAENVGVDYDILNLWLQTLGGDEIVDTPACILLTGLETVRPPGIRHLLRIKRAEGVYEATI